MDDLLERLRAARPVGEIDSLHEEAKRLAVAHDLAIYPGIPYVQHEATLSADQMALKDFVALTARLDARILYIGPSRYRDSESEEEPDLPPETMTHLGGAASQLQLAFADTCVLHA